MKKPQLIICSAGFDLKSRNLIEMPFLFWNRRTWTESSPYDCAIIPDCENEEERNGPPPIDSFIQVSCDISSKSVIGKISFPTLNKFSFKMWFS